jgi:DNA repair exonuclease SbcCD ATPase subunit
MEETGAVSADLRTLKLQLALLRAGCLLAAEGQPRVTSSELLFRAQKEEGIDALPSVVGQLLGSLGIPSTTSKGKTRFWLEPKRLEPLMEELTAQVEIVEEEADRVIRSLGDIQSRLAPLEERFQRAQRQQQREQEVREFLREHKPFMSELPFLEQERLRLQEALARLKRLKEQVQWMEQQLATRGELEEKRKSLAQRVKDLETQREEAAREEQALAREERELAGVINQLKLQRAWVSLASLQEEITLAQAELAGVKKEINRHRSWLERLLRRQDRGDEE